jgi:hypothetical protein
MYSFIVNPETGRKVNINGYKGHHILSNYLQIIQVAGATESKAESKSNYSNKRQFLNKISETVRRIRIGRKNNKSHVIPQQGLSTEQSWRYPRMKKKEIKQARSQLSEEFIMIESIQQNGMNVVNQLLDQEDEGACSFVGFLNGSILSEKTENVAPSLGVRKWKNNWQKLQHHLPTENSSPDIAATLDAMKQVRILDDNGLQYVPIRSAGAREQNYNTNFWVEESILIEKYNINADEYQAAPFVYQNMNLLEGLIDSNIPVILNSLEHTRTLVGYNDDKFIFADNWGPSNKSQDVYVDSHYAKLEDNFIAGFSTVKKWAIVSSLRDIVYWG